MIIECDTDSVVVWDSGYAVNKGKLAIIVVGFDLFISFFLWCALVAGRPFQSATNEDVNGELVMPQDFTVVLEVPPYRDEIKDLKAVYWAWALNVLEEHDDKQKWSDDINSNEVFNVDFGLNTIGYMDHMQRMGKLLKKYRKNMKQR